MAASGRDDHRPYPPLTSPPNPTNYQPTGDAPPKQFPHNSRRHPGRWLTSVSDCHAPCWHPSKYRRRATRSSSLVCGRDLSGQQTLLNTSCHFPMLASVVTVDTMLRGKLDVREFIKQPMKYIVVATLLFIISQVGAHAEQTIIQCAGMERAYDRAKHLKLPAIMSTRTFAFDDVKDTISERLGQQWILLDSGAIVDSTDISARYTKDYPDGRVDVIFEFNRVSNMLIYIMDIDERPGELFAAQCNVASSKAD